MWYFFKRSEHFFKSSDFFHTVAGTFSSSLDHGIHISSGGWLKEIFFKDNSFSLMPRVNCPDPYHNTTYQGQGCSLWNITRLHYSLLDSLGEETFPSLFLCQLNFHYPPPPSMDFFHRLNRCFEQKLQNLWSSFSWLE